MNEEKQLATLVGLDLILSPEHYKEITKLQQENKQLKERINDAIDYINKNKQIENTYKCSVDGITREFNTYELYCEPSELLEILGGKENE